MDRNREVVMKIVLSKGYLEWAHRWAAEDGEDGSVQIIEACDQTRGERVTLDLEDKAVCSELRSVANLWCDPVGWEAVGGYVRTARRILREVPR
jgi:hypothetical protein